MQSYSRCFLDMKMETLKEIITNEIIAIEGENNKIPSAVHSIRSPVNTTERLSPKMFREDFSNKENFMNSSCCNDCNRSSPSKSREREQPSRSSMNSSTNLK